MVVIDPAMADNGVLYKGFTPEFAHAMAELCGKADLIIPNLTEASFMLGIEYNPNYDEDYIRDVLKKLCSLGAKRAALTGISFDPTKLGVYAYDSTTDSYFSYYNDYKPVAYHGTGDIFASATLGALMRDHSVESALSVAVDYTLECIKLTMDDENRRTYGVNFEEAIPYYIERLKRK
jgi:pyridoxine kinase